MSKVALLIDAENISHRDLPSILEAVPRFGELILGAVYGDWNRPDLEKWQQAATANEFHVRHQTSAAKSKNASDMKLIMDAMEVLYRTPAEVFCLASNDADYVALCEKLNSAGKQVIGLGYKHAAETLIRACDQYVFIGHGEPPLQAAAVPVSQPVVQPVVSANGAAKGTSNGKPPQPASQPAPAQPAPPTPADLRALRKLVRESFAKTSQDADGWLLLAALGSALRQLQPDFQASSYGSRTLYGLLETLPDTVELRDVNGVRSTRLRYDPAAAMRRLVAQAFATAPHDVDGWVSLSALGSALRQVKPGFSSKNYGHATLSKLLQNHADLVELRNKGTVKSARLKK